MELSADKVVQAEVHLLQAEVQVQVQLAVIQDNQVQHYKVEVHLVIILLGLQDLTLEVEYLIELTTDILAVAEAQVTTEAVAVLTTMLLEAVADQVMLILL
mgnify:CR=1 FL=1